MSNNKLPGLSKPRNPVARSPLLRKGGVHQTTQSAKRQQSKQALRDEVADWREELAFEIERQQRSPSFIPLPNIQFFHQN